MTLNHFFKPKNRVSLKAALRRMRSMWLKGPVDHFDEKVFLEAVEKLRNWIITNKDDKSEISMTKFADELEKLGVLTYRQSIIQKFVSEGLLGETETIGAWKVLK